MRQYSECDRRIQTFHAKKKGERKRKTQRDTSKLMNTMLSSVQLSNLAKAVSPSPTNLLSNLLIKRMS